MRSLLQCEAAHMQFPLEPVTLESFGVRLEPLSTEHSDALIAAASDGVLWRLHYTSVPRPAEMHDAISSALRLQREGRGLPFAVREMRTGTIIGSTRYQEVQPHADRVQIGHTWYAAGHQRTHVNKACKFLLLRHAFCKLGCATVSFRTDILNTRSQGALQALGARFEGVLRQSERRRNGSLRDVVYYSILSGEWPDVERNLLAWLKINSLSPFVRSDSPTQT